MMHEPNTLHCGACHTPMASTDELNAHLTSCPAAKAMLVPITALMFGARDPSHFAMHLLVAANKNVDLIRQYASAIATEMTSFDRSQIHQRLCKKLAVDYCDFRPFEADDIDEVPNQEEAEALIWKAINRLAMDTLSKHSERQG